MANRTTRREITRASLAAALVTISATACSTLDVVHGFNVTPHGTSGDPAATPRQAAARLLRTMVVDEMTGAYFEKDIDDWFTWAEAHATSCATGVACAPFEDEALADAVRHAGSHSFQRIRGQLAVHAKRDAPWRSGIDPDPGKLCADGAINTNAQRIADGLRFETSLARVVARASAWCDEGLVDCQNDLATLDGGLKQGFEHAAAYLDHRKWHRDPKHAHVGLVLSGGGSNGMFSAGATWQLLQIVEGCMHAKTPCGDVRFGLVSGTSAGSMVASIVDLYNAQYDHGEGTLDPNAVGAPLLQNLVDWFTCLGPEQLYCADDADTLSLLTSRSGISTFDGIRYLLGKNIQQSMLDNSSELFLNAVDFQSGYLLSPSDQDPGDTQTPCDVVEHALSSIPEPLIAKPIPALRLDGFEATDKKGTRGFFLDGGVLSVLPLMPLIRHGADRVVMISNSPSIAAGTTKPGNALDLLERYIDISVDGSGAEGVNLATSFAEVRRGSEQAACLDLFAAKGCASAACQALCAGDVLDACATPKPAPTPPPASIAQERTFPMIAIYRDDTHVESASGYSFSPADSFRMFLAGAAAVRQRCDQLGFLLGVPFGLKQQLRGWCNTPLPVADFDARCAKADFPLPDLKHDDPSTVRTCKASTWTGRLKCE